MFLKCDIWGKVLSKCRECIFEAQNSKIFSGEHAQRLLMQQVFLVPPLSNFGISRGYKLIMISTKNQNFRESLKNMFGMGEAWSKLIFVQIAKSS